MRVLIRDSAETMSRTAASIIADLVRSQPDCVLGLATGGTPVGTYEELVRMHREEGLDFSRVTTFNLDEYVGLEPDHPQSYRYFMQQNLFDHINVRPENTHVPSGAESDHAAYGQWYEEQIAAAGGIDLQLLGIGGDGHLAFNEPGSSLASRTRMVVLAEQTIRDNARFFDSAEEVPQAAISMGMGTILAARRCVMLASGISKAKPVREALEGPVSAMVPASALQLHADTTVVLDRDAADLLELREYHERVEAVTNKLALASQR